MRHDHFSMLPERAFSPRGGRFGGMTLEGGGKGGSAPPAPDYTGAAKAQAESSVETTNMANYANRPTINTPFGGQSWQTESVVDPATGQNVTKWTQNTTLTPDAQAALDDQLAMQKGRSEAALGLMPSAKQDISTAIDYNALPQWGGTPSTSNFQGLGPSPTLATSFDYDKNLPTYDQAYVQNIQNQAMEYMRPDQEYQMKSLESRLANQGITQGSEAYNNSMRRLLDQQSRDKYNALNTAMSQGSQMYANQLAGQNQGYSQSLGAAGFGNTALGQQQGLEQQAATLNNQNMQNLYAQKMGNANYQNQIRQAQIAEAQQRQTNALNNINALISGQQVSMPQMPSFNANQAAQPVNYLGAAQAQGQYSLQQQQMQNASDNSAMSGAFGLGGSLLGAGAKLGAASMMMSDKRLKTNIRKIMDIKVNGKTLGWYRYNYLGSSETYEGVMAQEVKKVKPEAVKRHRSGFDMVNYAELGA
jgi:hypothetical protein